MKSYQKLLLANKMWASEKLKLDPAYFENLSKGQTPEFLWIGCSDSRVPPNEVTGTQPGEIFIHRNIANMVVHTDVNMLSVLQYAVEVLKVKHILLVGHYGCGGVKAAMSNQQFGLIDNWICNIKDVYNKHTKELEQLADDARFDRLVELNVEEQVRNLIKTSIIQKQWKENNIPHIHGWVFNLNNGHINQIIEVEPKDVSYIEDIYRL